MTQARRTVSEAVVHAAHTIPGEVARRIRLAVFDVDGVLTDAGVYLGETEAGEGVELKRFNIQDGLGLKFLDEAGIHVVLISGRVSPATSVRARELDLELHQDGGARKRRPRSSMMPRCAAPQDDRSAPGVFKSSSAKAVWGRSGPLRVLPGVRR